MRKFLLLLTSIMMVLGMAACGGAAEEQEQNGNTPEATVTTLLEAIKSNKIELVELLLNHGAKIDIEDKEGNTPISLAHDLHQNNIVELLIKYSKNATK